MQRKSQIKKLLSFTITFLLSLHVYASDNFAADSAEADEGSLLFFGERLNTDIFELNSDVDLKVTLPDYNCPSDVERENFCFHSDRHKKKALILDPGHTLSLNSARNGRHDEIHEGYLNMVVATLTKHYLKKCFAYNSQTKTGVKPERVYLSYYPGETHYGDFDLRTAKTTENEIVTKSSGRRRSHIDRLLSSLGASRSGVVISIHADAPDYSSDTNRMTEFPYVMYRKERPESKRLARNTYEVAAAKMKEYFFKSQHRKFEVQQRGPSSFYLPQLFRASEKNNPNYGSTKSTIDGDEISYRTRESAVLWEMRSGSVGTEAILVEGFFMDSLGAGKNIQNELKNERVSRVYYSLLKGRQETPISFPKFRLNITSEKNGRISYRTTKVKDELGLKISKVYKDYSLSLVKGLQKTYSCR